MARLGSMVEDASIQSISLDRTVAVLFAVAESAGPEEEDMRMAGDSNRYAGPGEVARAGHVPAMRSWADGVVGEETTCRAAAVVAEEAAVGECNLAQRAGSRRHGAAQAMERCSAGCSCRLACPGWRVPAAACSDRHRCALVAAGR